MGGVCRAGIRIEDLAEIPGKLAEALAHAGGPAVGGPSALATPSHVPAKTAEGSPGRSSLAASTS
jgi:hypothetical protein